MQDLELARCDDAERWEGIVARCREATVFHRGSWLELVAALSASELVRYEVRSRGAVVGACPLFFFRRGPVRLAAPPPPQSAAQYLGPAVPVPLLLPTLQAAAQVASQQGAAYELIASKLASASLAKVFVARHEGRVLAAGIFPFDSRTVYYLDGVSYSDAQTLRPNNLLHWEVIRWASVAGLEHYDMVGAGVAGVARFKRTFGPREVPYTYCYRSLRFWASLARRAYALLAPAGRAIRYVAQKYSGAG